LLQTLGLLLTVLEFNNCLKILAVLGLLDILLQLLVHLGELHLLKISISDCQFLLLVLLHKIYGDFLIFFWAKMSLGIKCLRLLHLRFFRFFSVVHLHLDILLILHVLQFPKLLLDLEGFFLALNLILELLLEGFSFLLDLFELLIDSALCL